MSYPHDNNVSSTPDVVEYSLWNPFIPTERDVERTEELAKKDPTTAGVLAIFFAPAAMIYLNRGVNSLKILGYVFVIAFMLGFFGYNSKKSESQLDKIGHLISFSGSIAIIFENVRCVSLARKRLAFQSKIEE
jgi:hypothetical protein